MTSLIVCEFNLVYQQKTEGKKVGVFGWNPYFGLSKKYQKPKKKDRAPPEIYSLVDSRLANWPNPVV